MTDKKELFPLDEPRILTGIDAEYADSLKEHMQNKSYIDLAYWFQLKLWTPEEAIYLLNLFDPDITLKEGDYNKGILDKNLRMAERDQDGKSLPPTSMG